ncbi:hypothetical protein RB595_000349 [Gaeumannomyces hyphopodioides]
MPYARRIRSALAAVVCIPNLASAVPAAVTTGTSSAGTPLFQYETVQLGAEDVARLGGQHAPLIDFEHEGNPAPVLDADQCRAFPGTDSWPAQSAWDALDSALGGALIPTVPAAAPCYRNWGKYDAEKCAAVVANWTNPYFHEADPTSIMWPLWQGRTCMPTLNGSGAAAEDGCTLGGYPAYAVNVSTVAQVQLAVNFARNANVRLVVKNTGHCYLGKSSGAGALAIWTHRLKDVEFLPEYTGGPGGYEGPAFKVGAGVTVREIYRAADKNGVTVSGGICESVGFTGGYLQGGGHTPMSGLHGMAADHVMALEVVTADGRFVTASPASNPDLFWALRGGGGGTYGVVTSAVVRAHPRVPVVTSWFNLSTYSPLSGAVEATPDAFWAGVRAFFERFVEWTDAGTYSYFWLYNDGGGRLRLEVEPFWAPNHTLESFDALTGPFFAHVRDGLRLPGFEPRTRAFDAFYPAYHDSWGNETVGRVHVPANRLFPRSGFEDPARFNATLDALRVHAEEGTGRIWGGYHQAPRNRSGVDNGVSSAWRNAVAFLIAAMPLPDDASPAAVGAANARLLDVIMRRWRDAAPASEGGGSYLNEGTPVEPDWQASYYGEQYARLLEIKRRWDPSEVFYVTTGVGSEGWEVRDGEQGTQTQNGRLCRV